MQSLKKTSLRLPSSLTAKIKINSDKNQQSFSDYLRHLLELGLRIEDMQNSPTEPNKNLEALVYKSVLETGMIARAILRYSSHVDKEMQEHSLLCAKEKATNIVKSFLGEDCLDEAAS